MRFVGTYIIVILFIHIPYLVDDRALSRVASRLFLHLRCLHLFTQAEGDLWALARTGPPRRCRLRPRSRSANTPSLTLLQSRLPRYRTLILLPRHPHRVLRRPSWVLLCLDYLLPLKAGPSPNSRSHWAAGHLHRGPLSPNRRLLRATVSSRVVTMAGHRLHRLHLR